MAVAPKPKGINPELEKAVAKLLKDTMNSRDASLTDKCKAIDRALKLEMIKQKQSDEGFGSGFFEDNDDS